MTSFKDPHPDIVAALPRLFVEGPLGWLRWRDRPGEDGCFTRRKFHEGPMLSWVLAGGHPSSVVLPAVKVVCALHIGLWPDGPVERVNGDRNDIRFENLRFSVSDLV